jgi:hypothetical protein
MSEVEVEFTRAVFRYEGRTVVTAALRDGTWELACADLGAPVARQVADSWPDAQRIGLALTEDVVKARSVMREAEQALLEKWPRQS